MPGPLVPGMYVFWRRVDGANRSRAWRLSRRRSGWRGDVTRLILTSGSGMSLATTDRADVVVPFSFRFVWGPLPSEEELAFYLAARSPNHGPGERWPDYVGRWRSSDKAREDLGLIEFCKQCESVELWFDPDPNDQLLLIWLLDCLHAHPELAAKLRLMFVDVDLIGAEPKFLATWRIPALDVTEVELESASLAWKAFRATTPEACFDLLARDLSALPLLRPALHTLLQELPSSATGLGWTEMQLLGLIARGCSDPNGLFYHRSRGQHDVFNSWEIGYLLEGLAFGPRPTITGLDHELRTIKRDMTNTRLEAFRRSRLSITDFGREVLRHKEDFSRHNPIDRWWGGTHLTNDRLWRLKPVLMQP
jgi:hypothetical protein